MLIGAIILLVISLALAGISFYRSVRLVKTAMIEVNFKDFFIKSGYFVDGAVACFIGFSFMFAFRNGAILDIAHILQLALGSLLFIAPLFIAINAFIIHYYGKNIPENIDKWLYRTVLIGFTASVFFFFIYTNGLAPVLTYPIINGISFNDGFTRPPYKPNIAFYAICILSGAILVYFLCDHIMYKEYGKHGTLESTFFVGFPAGIIGARITYVIGEWNNSYNGKASFAERVSHGEWWAPFAIWEGGLTIVGGAIIGIIIGLSWYKYRNRDKNVFFAADILVPSILIAQAIGRWGNFFNCEVHGYAVDEAAWKWLPEIIFRNAHFSDSISGELVGKIYVPLFFIEAIVNLLGYFVLAHVFGKALRKYTEFGDLGAGYIVWYGLTRVFMEPLRIPDYQMGEKGFWSWSWSMVFVVVGTLLIVANHIIRFIIRKKKGEIKSSPSSMKVGIISSALIVIVGGALLASAIYLLKNNEAVLLVQYNPFNIGLMLLVVGISTLMLLGISVLKIVQGTSKEQTVNE